MDTSELNRKLKVIVIEVTHSSDEVEEIEDTDFLIDDLGVDSLGMMTLVEVLEKRYDIKIPPSEVTLDNFKTIELLGQYVKAKLEGATEG